MKKILYISPYQEFTLAQNGGYGVIAESFKRMFDTYEHTVDYINLTKLSNQEITFTGTYDICIILIHPSFFDNKIFKDNIEIVSKRCDKTYLHVFWETEPLPNKWKWLWTSELFTGFISPSTFIYDMINKETIKENHLIYCPMFKEDYDDYRINILEKEKEDIFTVLYVGQYTKRKGMEDAITGFVQALAEYDDCRLILKYHQLSDKEIEPKILISNIVDANTKNMNAKIFEAKGDLKKDEIYALYKKASVLLFPSRGEGYGLPLIEAGMVGLPCIYTDWSSTKETGEFKGNSSIDYVLDTAIGMAHYDYESPSLYAVPKIKSIVDNLKMFYNDWKRNKQDYYEVTNNNYELIDNKFGPKIFTKQFNKLIGE
jgi:glycosyltransferase involved in cell wall biosynthesis